MNDVDDVVAEMHARYRTAMKWLGWALYNEAPISRLNIRSREELDAACHPVPAAWSGSFDIPPVGARLAVFSDGLKETHAKASTLRAMVPCRVLGYDIIRGNIGLVVRPYDPNKPKLGEAGRGRGLHITNFKSISPGVVARVFEDEAAWLDYCASWNRDMRVRVTLGDRINSSLVQVSRCRKRKAPRNA